jgi:hypothetical protein
MIRALAPEGIKLLLMDFSQGLMPHLLLPSLDVRAEARTLQEKEEPQPQERVEFGLMKLNPCRINVSS